LGLNDADSVIDDEQPPNVRYLAEAACLLWARSRQAVGNPAARRGRAEQEVSRPSMRFVPVKSAERQAVLVLHRSRELLVRQRTMLANAIRGHCAEFGLVAPLGVRAVQGLMERMHAEPTTLPELAWPALQTLANQPVHR